jgi:hypothetical protein
LEKCVLYGTEVLPSRSSLLMVVTWWADLSAISELRSCLLSVMPSSILSFPKFLPSPRNLKLRHIPMLPLPLMSMQRKALTLWLRYPRKHAHLHNHHFRKNLRDAHDRTNESHQCSSSITATSRRPLAQIPTDDKKREKNLLPTLPTKAPFHTLPAPRRHVPVLLHLATFVHDFDFLFLDCQVGRNVGPCDFAAVGAVAQVAAWAREEL